MLLYIKTFYSFTKKSKDKFCVLKVCVNFELITNVFGTKSEASRKKAKRHGLWFTISIQCKHVWLLSKCTGSIAGWAQPGYFISIPADGECVVHWLSQKSSHTKKHKGIDFICACPQETLVFRKNNYVS